MIYARDIYSLASTAQAAYGTLNVLSPNIDPKENLENSLKKKR